MTQDELKAMVGQAALDHVVPGEIVGVGTGSTVNHFIDALGQVKERIVGAVSSSVASTQRLQALGIKVFDCNEVGEIAVYIDGADEIDGSGHMIKGGGAALTREKIVAAQAKRFVCIADESKLVDVLGRFPLPVEVIPMAAKASMARAFLSSPAARPTRLGKRRPASVTGSLTRCAAQAHCSGVPWPRASMSSVSSCAVSGSMPNSRGRARP